MDGGVSREDDVADGGTLWGFRLVHAMYCVGWRCLVWHLPNNGIWSVFTQVTSSRCSVTCQNRFLLPQPTTARHVGRALTVCPSTPNLPQLHAPHPLPETASHWARLMGDLTDKRLGAASDAASKKESQPTCIGFACIPPAYIRVQVASGLQDASGRCIGPRVPQFGSNAGGSGASLVLTKVHGTQHRLASRVTSAHRLAENKRTTRRCFHLNDWDFQHISLPNPPFPTSSHPVRLQHQAIRRTRDDGFECLIHGTFYHGHPDSGSLGRQKTGGEGSCCSWHVHPAWHGILRCPWKPYRRCNLPTNGPNAVPSGEGRDRLALGSRTRPKASSCEPAQARGLPSRHPPHRLPGKIPIASFSVSSSVSDTEKQPRPGIPQFSSR